MELLVAAFVLVIILSIVATFFVQQTRLNRRTQAGSEVQDKARMVMQLVTGDLHSPARTSTPIRAGPSSPPPCR